MRYTKWEKSTEYATYCVIAYLWHSGTGITMGTVKRSLVVKRLLKGVENRRSTGNI